MRGVRRALRFGAKSRWRVTMCVLAASLLLPSLGWAQNGAGLAVTGLSPDSGSMAGGERVLIEGSGFRRGMHLEVYLGGARCPSMVVEDAEHVLVTTPPSSEAGPVSLELRLPPSGSVVVLRAFTYVEASEEVEGDEGAGDEGAESGEGATDEGEGDDDGGENDSVGEGEASDDGGDESDPEGESGHGAQGDGEGADPESGTDEDPDAVVDDGQADSGSQEEQCDVDESDEEEEEDVHERFADQLESINHNIPEGMGAIFVPALTEPTLEPAIDIYRDGDLVESIPSGRRAVVPPGRYLVRSGRGNDRVRPRHVVEVVEGELAIVDPPWGALVIDVVNDRNIPHRGAYDLIRLDTRETVGQGRGADRRSGEGLRTWLLIPGVYKIVQVGGTYRERVDFATVQVNPGEAINFVLVMDEGTGEFRGAGIATESDTRVIGGLELRGALGGSLEFTHAYEEDTDDDQLTFGANIFVDFDLLYDEGWNYLWFQTQLEAGMQLFAQLGDSNASNRWNPTLDYGDIALIYIMQFHPRIGPYVRASYQTHLLPNYRYFDEGVTVTRVRVDEDDEGEEVLEELSSELDVERLTTRPPFSNNVFSEGIGANWRAVRSYFLDLDLRLGFGFRQVVTNDRLYEHSVEEDPAGGDTTYFYAAEERFRHDEGIDVGVVAAGSLTGWLSYDLEVGLLQPFEAPYIPFLDADLSITIRIFSFASLNYRLRVIYDPGLEASKWSIDQTVLLRFAFNFF